MAIPQIIIDKPETIQAQIKQLRDLMIDYHFTTVPWYKENTSALIALATLLVAFLTQRYIFKRTSKKELKRDIGKLYAEFSYYSKEYSIQLFEYNYSLLQIDTYTRIRKIVGVKGQGFITERATHYDNIISEVEPVYEKDKKRFRELKFSSGKPLFEIQFQLSSKKLEELIKSFEAIVVYTYGNDEVIPLQTMERTNYIVDLANTKVMPIKNQLDTIIIEIQTEIKSEIKKLKI